MTKDEIEALGEGSGDLPDLPDKSHMQTACHPMMREILGAVLRDLQLLKAMLHTLLTPEQLDAAREQVAKVLAELKEDQGGRDEQ